MSAFFVGQRVRVKRVDNPKCPCRVGAECRIVSGGYSWILDGEVWNLRAGLQEYCVTKYDAGDYLEPILGDDLKACDEDFKLDLDRLLERQGIAA